MKLTKQQLEEGITVLSLFDGMACGLQALKEAGIKVKAYYASEIDKDAIKVAKANHPEITHIGSVTDISYTDGVLITADATINVGKIDMLIGGSPCTGFSKVGKRLNFDDPRSRLFFDFARIKEEVNPTWFLLENVRMKPEFQAVITEHVGQEPNMINSALVSAQNRPRLYWTNIEYDRDIKDRGILLRDILQPEEDVEDRFYLSPEANAYMERSSDKWDKGNNRWYTNNNRLDHKAHCLTANMYKGVPYGCMKELNRKLTPIECERLQGVPDFYTASVSNSQRYKMLGNGWNIPTIAHIFNGLLPKTEIVIPKKLSAQQKREGITVLSLFDGISCGLVALKRVGIKVKAYYASEIDKEAMKVAKHNHPEIIHIGDVSQVSYVNGVLATENGEFEVGLIDMLIGGSPCTGFSTSGKAQHFEDPRSKLFFEYARIKEEIKPQWFLLENVKMKSDCEQVITEYMGVDSNLICSSMFSAQRRKRLYWSNIEYDRNIVDQGIVLADVLDDTEFNTHFKFLPEERAEKQRNNQWSRICKYTDPKSPTLLANQAKKSTDSVIVEHKDGLRWLTRWECELLQTLPFGYCDIVSESQAIKALGNGWTVDVIVHILNGIKDDEVTYDDEVAYEDEVTYEGRYLVLNRKHLKGNENNKPIGEIKYYDFNVTTVPLSEFRKANFVIFIDHDGRHKILKDRHKPVLY